MLVRYRSRTSYSALGEVYLPIGAALPNSLTRGREQRCALMDRARRGCHPRWRAVPGFMSFALPSPLAILPSTHRTVASGSFHYHFRGGPFRVRSPLLTESRLFSFPPVSDVLKFAGSCPTAEVQQVCGPAVASIAKNRAGERGEMSCTAFIQQAVWRPNGRERACEAGSGPLLLFCDLYRSQNTTGKDSVPGGTDDRNAKANTQWLVAGHMYAGCQLYSKT